MNLCVSCIYSVTYYLKNIFTCCMLLLNCSLPSCQSPLISKQFYLLEEWGQLNLEKGLGSEACVILCPFTNIQYLNPTIVPWNVKPSLYIPKWYQQKTNQSTNRKLVHNDNHPLWPGRCDSWQYNAKINNFWLLTEKIYCIFDNLQLQPLGRQPRCFIFVSYCHKPQWSSCKEQL